MRKGLYHVNFLSQDSRLYSSYNNVTSSGPVETEDLLNAGHCVEPDKEMQSCAITLDMTKTSKVISVAGFVIFKNSLRLHSFKEPFFACAAIAKYLVILLLNA